MTIQIQQHDASEASDLSIGDILTQQIHSKWLKLDTELYQTKWWDYRFMTPFEATMAYIDAFEAEARRIYARELDHERAAHITITSSASMQDKLSKNDVKARKQFAGYWRGRQVADALSVPYGFYVREAMTSRMRAWQRSYLPSSSHVYKDRDVDKVALRWEEFSGARIQYASHFAYLSQNFVGAADQVKYFSYLVDRAEKSSNRVMALADMVDSDRMPVEFLQTSIEPEIFEQVMNSLR